MYRDSNLDAVRGAFGKRGFALVLSVDLNALYTGQTVNTCLIQPYKSVATHKPGEGEGLCISAKNSVEGHGAQLIISDRGLYYRKIYNGTFNDWQTIFSY